jgi:Uma2 family endonuclease
MDNREKPVMSSTASDLPRRHRLTVEEYNRMGEAGIFHPEARTELIDGEIIDMAPPGSRHAGTVNQLDSLLQAVVGPNAIVLVQNPIWLGRYSEPQPDLALAKPRRNFYRSAHPQPDDLLLVVEVADSSLRFDRDVKAALYARHVVPEVWLIDVRAKRLARYRNPASGVYEQVDEPDLGAPIDVPAGPNLRVDLAPLFDD